MALFFLKKYRYLLFAAFATCSCAQDININTPDEPSELVVDGWIEPGQPVRVLLTATVNFSDPIDSASYLNIVMTRAKVSVIEDGVKEVLTLRRDTSYFPQHVYMSNKTRGKVGSEYTIIAEYEGQTATGTSTILAPPQIDSAWFATDEGQDSLGFIWLSFRDPVGEKNFYRIRTILANREHRYIGAQISAYSDNLFTDEKCTIPVYKGMKNISEKMIEHRFRIGDTVTLCLSSIGKEEFTYWTSLDRAIVNTGNPFITGGTNLPSNMSNGLGIWSAYGSSYVTVVCKK